MVFSLTSQLMETEREREVKVLGAAPNTSSSLSLFRYIKISPLPDPGLLLQPDITFPLTIRNILSTLGRIKKIFINIIGRTKKKIYKIKEKADFDHRSTICLPPQTSLFKSHSYGLTILFMWEWMNGINWKRTKWSPTRIGFKHSLSSKPKVKYL